MTKEHRIRVDETLSWAISHIMHASNEVHEKEDSDPEAKEFVVDQCKTIVRNIQAVRRAVKDGTLPVRKRRTRFA